MIMLSIFYHSKAKLKQLAIKCILYHDYRKTSFGTGRKKEATRIYTKTETIQVKRKSKLCFQSSLMIMFLKCIFFVLFSCKLIILEINSN